MKLKTKMTDRYLPNPELFPQYAEAYRILDLEGLHDWTFLQEYKPQHDKIELFMYTGKGFLNDGKKALIGWDFVYPYTLAGRDGLRMDTDQLIKFKIIIYSMIEEAFEFKDKYDRAG